MNTDTGIYFFFFYLSFLSPAKARTLPWCWGLVVHVSCMDEAKTGLFYRWCITNHRYTRNEPWSFQKILVWSVYACHIQSDPINPIKATNWLNTPVIRHGILAEFALMGQFMEAWRWCTDALPYRVYDDVLRPVIADCSLLINRNWRLVKENSIQKLITAGTEAECWSLQL